MGDLFSRVARRLEHESKIAAKHAAQAIRYGRRGVGKPALFVGGVQRSGTEMMMAVLERSPETRVYHESDPRAFCEYQMRDLAVIRELVESARAPVVVLKSLCEGHKLKVLLAELVPARALWVVRRYEDMINSHIKTWTGCPQIIGEIINDRARGGWRGLGMSDETLRVVRQVYHPDMTPASAVGLFWYFRNQLFFDQGLGRNEHVMVVRYEPLVRAPEQAFARVFEFAGLAFDSRFVCDVHAGSIGKNTAPEIEPAVRKLCDGIVGRFDALGVG